MAGAPSRSGAVREEVLCDLVLAVLGCDVPEVREPSGQQVSTDALAEGRWPTRRVVPVAVLLARCEDVLALGAVPVKTAD